MSAIEPDLEHPPVWEYVPVSDYKIPPGTMTLKVKGGFAGFWEKLRSSGRHSEASLKSEADLQKLPDTLLDRVAPVLDFGEAAISLERSLTEWINSRRNHISAVVVIGQPQSKNSQVLNILAKKQNLQRLEVPSSQQILSNDETWLEQVEESKVPWVLPSLETCYLRHPNGLALVRQFFAKLRSGVLEKGIIGCDSWAWAYLKYVIRGSLMEELVAQAFNHDRLIQLFQNLAECSGGKQFIFRQSDNGCYVLPPSLPSPDTDRNPIEITHFMKEISAYSRGIPGIAWQLWRQALRKIPDEQFDEDIHPESDDSQTRTVWVLPWEKFKQPSVPASREIDHALVLHSLLLHNGLAQDVLIELLPLSSSVTIEVLLLLKDAGLIENSRKIWKVSALGYPIVRQFLKGEGYITDNL